MRVDYKGSTILITGASSGIGREMARQLAGQAGTLVLTARRTERLEELKAELTGQHSSLNVAVIPCDLADNSARNAYIARVQEEVGAVDVLINNAGFGDTAFFETTDWSKLQKMVQLNIEALTHLMHAFLGGMVERKKGGILNVSSGFGMVSIPLFGVYCGTKHYVTALTEAVRAEVKPAGVVISQLCPGPVATEFVAVAGNPMGQDPPKVFEISAEDCSRIALKGFSRGKATIIPGFLMKVMMAMHGLTPRWFFRFLISLAGGSIRRQLKLNP